MKFVGRIGITLVTALVVMMAMVEARTDRAHAQTGADTLRLAFSMPFKTLDPLSGGLRGPKRNISVSLQLPDGAATRWRVHSRSGRVLGDVGPGEKKWTFHLRPEARFHDGSPVTRRGCGRLPAPSLFRKRGPQAVGAVFETRRPSPADHCA